MAVCFTHCSPATHCHSQQMERSKAISRLLAHCAHCSPATHCHSQQMERCEAISRLLAAAKSSSSSSAAAASSSSSATPGSLDRQAWLREQLSRPESHQAHMHFELNAVMEAVEMQNGAVAKMPHHSRRQRPLYNNARREAKAAAKRKQSPKRKVQAENTSIDCI